MVYRKGCYWQDGWSGGVGAPSSGWETLGDFKMEPGKDKDLCKLEPIYQMQNFLQQNCN